MITHPENKIRSFEDLKAWQEAHRLVLIIYSCTKKFPKDEIFGLSSQIRRAAVSVSSNIAEGFSRRTEKEKVQFYYQANGSLAEVKSQLLIARDLQYIDLNSFEGVFNLAGHTQALLQGLIKFLRSKTTVA